MAEFLTDIETLRAHARANIEQVEVLGRHDDCSVLSFLLEVKDRVHLAQIMRSVRNMKSVKRVSRDCA